MNLKIFHLICFFTAMRWLSRGNVLFLFFSYFFSFWIQWRLSWATWSPVDFRLGFFGQHAALSESTECGSAKEFRDAAWPGAACFHICQQTQADQDTSTKERQFTHFPSLLKASGQVAEVVKVSTAGYATLLENLKPRLKRTNSTEINYISDHPIHCWIRLFKSLFSGRWISVSAWNYWTFRGWQI